MFLRFAYREHAIGRDLSPAVEWPSSYRLASIPRSITWEEVGRMLAEVDRRSPHGKRDWVPERKAGHSTAFPSGSVGDALVDYLKHGRPQSEQRQLCLRAVAPVRPMTAASVAARAAHYLRKAQIDVPRPGSHTLRHTCVQRLVEAEFSLKTIGHFVGHRSAQSTEIYAKVAVEQLREVALGDGEEILG